MFNLRGIFDRYASRGDCYQLAATLDGHTGAVNGFSFNQIGTLLASGGDDQEVRIWDTKTFRQVQTLRDAGGRWGQITCIKFVGIDGIDWLYFGTGRGLVLVFRRGRKPELIEVSSNRVFHPSDSVESVAFEPLHQRLAVSSHFGQVKVYNWNSGNIMDLWSEEMTDVIPRALLFGEKGRSLMIYGMENGSVLCRDAETAAEKYRRVLKSPIGNISTCPAEKYVLVDNMTDGFDLYSSNRTSPLQSFQVPSTRKFVKKGVFAEKGGIITCGSDHGKVYVFGTNSSEPIQILKHGGKDHLVQTIESATCKDHHLLASGSSNGRYEIRIWQKPTKEMIARAGSDRTLEALVLINGLVVLMFVWFVMDPWFVLTMERVKSASTTTFERIPEATKNLLPDIRANRRAQSVDYEALLDMDDETLRKILGVRKMLDNDIADDLNNTD